MSMEVTQSLPFVNIYRYGYGWASLGVQLVKHPLAIQETLVQFLGQKDPLEKGYVTHSSILGLPWWLREYLPPEGELGGGAAALGHGPGAGQGQGGEDAG